MTAPNWTDRPKTFPPDDDIEILQFTGQKDMNNVEVFQRDIIEIENLVRTERISWPENLT